MEKSYYNIPAKTFFLSHEQCEAIYGSEIAAEIEKTKKAHAQGTNYQMQDGKLMKIAKMTSQCLHEDWRQNLINEKGKTYQHWRPLKDDQRVAEILKNPEMYASQTSTETIDGQTKNFHLYQFFDNKGNEIKPEDVKNNPPADVKFDLIRVPFEKLTQKWQDANLDAAKYAVALIKNGLDNGAFRGTATKCFSDLEMMSHDVHIEWMQREEAWGDVRLFFPYELLTSAEQSKDRAQLLTIMNGVSFRSDILARNRAIVVRALKEVMAEYIDDNGLKQDIMNGLESAMPIVEKSNQIIDNRHAAFKEQLKSKAAKMLDGKSNFTFSELENLSAMFYEEWKQQAAVAVRLPKDYNCSYDSFLPDNEKFNFKNYARMEVADLVKELASEGLVSETLLAGVEQMNDKNSEITRRVDAKNQEDISNYKATMSGLNGPQ